MPRLKGQAERQRSTRACTSCRRRKEKCDGEQPCAGCAKRNIGCVFAPIASPSAPRASSSVGHPEPLLSVASKRRKILHLNDEVDSSEAEGVIDRCLNPSASSNPRKHSVEKSPYEESPAEAPVPRAARLLRDGRGKFIYIGDSASLSFLQNVRRIALSVVGECSLTTDRLRHSFLEQTPAEIPMSKVADDFLGAHGTDLIPTQEEAEMLTNSYLTATACILDLFETKTLFRDLKEWVLAPAKESTTTCPIFYLIMAIGAQSATNDEWNERSVRYFGRGRQLALYSFTNEPSIQTVQSFVLIAIYMLAETRRNAAFMTLGMAVRAAYALGLHRGDIQTLFSETERKSRERTWQSLRLIDLFLSASLGRPSATSDFEKDPSVEDSIRKKADTATNDEKFAYSVLRLVSIFERILSEVYKKRSISVEVADDITRQYREWTSELPQLPTDITNGPLSLDFADLARKIASAQLIGAYHWSIILLTRPFLMFYVSLHQQKRNGEDKVLFHESLSGSTISTYAEASIDSAIRGIDIAADLITYSDLPRRLPFVTNSVFNSALVVGAAFFADFDRSYPLGDGMEKAERILAHMSTHEPQARRYAQLIGFLSSAAKEYVYRRDTSSMQNRRLKKNELFGIVGLNSPPAIPNPTNESALRSTTSQNTHRRIPVETMMHPTDYNGTTTLSPPDSRVSEEIFPYTMNQPTLTTSGLLLSTGSKNTPKGMNDLSTTLSSNDMQYGWDMIGGEDLFSDMMPMFNLFSESEPPYDN